MEYIAFRATSEASAFPTDNGNDTYNLKAWDYERLSNGQTHEFNSYVEVYIPNGKVGRIYANPNESENVIELELSGGQWHQLKFTVQYNGQKSAKIYGERNLAILKVEQSQSLI